MNFPKQTKTPHVALSRALTSIALALFAVLASPGHAQATTVHCMPFNGEQMVFSTGWEFINAGTADMRIETSPSGYRVLSHGISNKFLDMFHKVRDTIISEGECTDHQLQSTLFDIEQNEGTYHSKKQVRFLWRDKLVTHTQNGKTDKYSVPPGHLNAIDAFFRVRKMQLKPGMKLHIPIFDSRKQYEIEVDVLKREKLFAPWGKSVDCLLIIPRLKTKGIFSSKGTVKLWLTDDARHIPLKMTAKVKIGRIVAKLESYRAGDASNMAVVKSRISGKQP
ncbi:MAG: DUF3108 domain-containing protein [Mariprofundaceae bacterium]|nr:DUF3108 domain-containing protein [Mariprofundaceae bacterium]